MTHAILFPALTLLALGLSGCGSSTENKSANTQVSPTTTAGHGAHSEHDHADHAHSDEHGMSDMEKMKVELAKLAPADAAAAEEQHICPVTEEMLGTMGAPIKVDVKGQDVWICCEGCRDALLENPAEYLAKLKK